MKIKVLHNEEAYEAALRELESLMDADPPVGSTQFEQLELLALVIKDYEDKHFPMAKPDPIEAIKFRLEQQGFDRSYLAKILGGKDRAVEVLNRQRRLSLAMIRALHHHLQIPADVLIARPARQRNLKAVST